MLDKIKTIEVSNIESNSSLEEFIIKNQAYFDQIATLGKVDFLRLNDGVSYKDILAEKELVRKYGGL
jgi:hypothetical protein